MIIALGGARGAAVNKYGGIMEYGTPQMCAVLVILVAMATRYFWAVARAKFGQQ